MLLLFLLTVFTILVFVFQIVVEGYDSAWPQNVVQGTLTIFINRNPGVITFSPTEYSTTIDGDFPVGDIVFTLSASDTDGVSLDKIKFTVHYKKSSQFCHLLFLITSTLFLVKHCCATQIKL